MAKAFLSIKDSEFLTADYLKEVYFVPSNPLHARQSALTRAANIESRNDPRYLASAMAKRESGGPGAAVH